MLNRITISEVPAGAVDATLGEITEPFTLFYIPYIKANDESAIEKVNVTPFTGLFLDAVAESMEELNIDPITAANGCGSDANNLANSVNQKAADFYGYKINLVEADMRDLSCMQSDFYDLVFQAESLCYIPHVKEVFSQVSSLLKRGGRYRSAFHDPVAFSLEWDGVRYGLNRGYRQRELYREDGGVEFRHRLDEIFNGLLDEGFLIRAR